MPKFSIFDRSNVAIGQLLASSKLLLPHWSRTDRSDLIAVGPEVSAGVMVHTIAGGEATERSSGILVAEIVKVTVGAVSSSCRNDADSQADGITVRPGMSLDEIAALTCLKDRALALTFVAIDRTCPKARALVHSVNVPEAGPDGLAVQAKLMPPPPKKRGKRVPKPVCPDTALKAYFPNLFAEFDAAPSPVSEAADLIS